jgi:hypothetical protein
MKTESGWPDRGSIVISGHYRCHDKSKTVAECSDPDCVEYASERAAKVAKWKNCGNDRRPLPAPPAPKVVEDVEPNPGAYL